MDTTTSGSLIALKIELERIEALLQLALSRTAASSTSFAGPIVPNEAAMRNLIVPNGTEVFVLSHRSVWTKINGVAGTTAPPLQPHVVDPSTDGTGVFVRDSQYCDAQWRLGITDVYVDLQNTTGIANDENQGIFRTPQVGNARQPLLTLQEVYRRWGERNTITTGDPVGLTITVHIISGETALTAPNDSFELSAVGGTDTYPRVVGESATTLLAGNLDAVAGFTAQNPAVPAPGGTPCSIKVGAQAWAAFIGKRIRFTASGAVATILKDLGAGSARISQPQLTNESTFAASPTNFNPPNGAAFVVEDLTNVNPGQFHFEMTASNLGFAGQMNWLDLNIMTLPAGYFQWQPELGPNLQTLLVLYQCTSDRPISQDASLILNGCSVRSQFFGTGIGAGAMFGGAIVPGAFPISADLWSASKQFFNFGCFDFSAYSQGGVVATRGPWTGGIFSIWDTPVQASLNPGGHGILIGGGPNIGAGASNAVLRSSNIMFGSGQAGKGCRVAPGSQISAYQTLPNITGTTGDVALGDSATAWFFDVATATYQPAAGPLALSWAAIAAAQPGGFGGSAHRPDINAHINKAATT